MTTHERPAPADASRTKVGRRLLRVVLVFLAVLALAAAGLRPEPVAEASSRKPSGGSPSEHAPQGSKREPSTTSSTSTTSTTAAPTTTTTAAPTTTTTAAPTTTSTTVAAPPAPAGSVLWHADADRDNDMGSHTLFMDKNADALPTSRLSIVPDPLGRYGKVYRANLTAADIDSGQNRAEWNEALLGDGETELNLWGEDAPSTTDLFVGWRSMFGGNLALTGADNDGNFLQWKGDSSCGGPAVGMTVRDNRLTIRTIDGDHLAWNGPLMSSLMDGQWHDFVLRVNFSKTSTGFVELWLDGQRQTMLNGLPRIYLPTVCPNDAKVFPKWGVYGMDDGVGAGPIHWVESPRIGTSYTAAAPR